MHSFLCPGSPGAPGPLGQFGAPGPKGSHGFPGDKGSSGKHGAWSMEHGALGLFKHFLNRSNAFTISRSDLLDRILF